MKWTDDDNFMRGAVPMTKAEVRILTVAALELVPGQRFLDIGAGTGSISVAAAASGCTVDACECHPEALGLIVENAKAFDVSIDILAGKAPDVLSETAYDRIFIGGSKGRLDDILGYCHGHLTSGGIVCGNFVTPANAVHFREFLKARGYLWTFRYIAVSREDRFGMLRAENGVFMVKGQKP